MDLNDRLMCLHTIIKDVGLPLLSIEQFIPTVHLVIILLVLLLWKVNIYSNIWSSFIVSPSNLNLLGISRNTNHAERPSFDIYILSQCQCNSSVLFSSLVCIVLLVPPVWFLTHTFSFITRDHFASCMDKPCISILRYMGKIWGLFGHLAICLFANQQVLER